MNAPFPLLDPEVLNMHDDFSADTPQYTRVEADPFGLDQHQPGAKVDAGKVRMHLITGGMARAITAIARIGTFGAAKYSDNGWITVPDGFRRYEDAQQRHAATRHMGETLDPDSNELHLAHEAWNAMAKLDLYLREQERADAITF